MMLNVSVLGASGRMGRSLLACIAEDKDLRLVGALTEPSDPAVGKDVGITVEVLEIYFDKSGTVYVVLGTKK